MDGSVDYVDICAGSVNTHTHKWYTAQMLKKKNQVENLKLAQKPWET